MEAEYHLMKNESSKVEIMRLIIMINTKIGFKFSAHASKLPSRLITLWPQIMIAALCEHGVDC